MTNKQWGDFLQGCCYICFETDEDYAAFVKEAAIKAPRLQWADSTNLSVDDPKDKNIHKCRKDNKIYVLAKNNRMYYLTCPDGIEIIHYDSKNDNDILNIKLFNWLGGVESEQSI